MRFQTLVREIGSLAGNRKERYKDMLKRVVYGVLAGSAVIFAILCLPKFIGNILVTLLAIGGTNEFIKAMEKGGYKPLKAIPYLTCLGLLFVNGESSIMAYKISFSIFSFLILIILIYALFMTKRTLVDVCLSCFAMLYIPFLLSFVLNTYYFDDIGTYAIWFILFGACLTDAFAYFVGVKFGRHKLCPNISPKKTIEGAIGGIVGTTIVFVIYCSILNNYCGFSIQYWEMVVFGLVCSIFAQIGDLIASAIKRYVNTKDFGSFIPGHGGVLDRLDSVLFVAPICYYAVLLFESFLR